MFERDLRVMSVVQRWGIVPVIRRQNLAEHSYFVTMYANDICVLLGVTDDTRLDVLKACLGHDLDEILTGDIPGPHKQHVMVKNSQWMYESMGKIFRLFEQRWGFDKSKRGVVKAIVKTADLLESVMYLLEEQRLGNQNISEHTDVLVRETLEKAEGLRFINPDHANLMLRAIEDAVSLARFVPLQNSRITYDGGQ